MLNNLHPLALWSFLLALVCLIGIVVLTGLHDTVPAELTNALYVTLGSGAGSGLVTKPTTT